MTNYQKVQSTVVTLLLLTGCGSSPSLEEAPQSPALTTTSLMGQVGASPRAGFPVVARAADGTVIATSVSSSGGLYHLQISAQQGPFEIVVTQDATTHYRARVESGPQGQPRMVVSANTATTLAAVYAESHPGLSLAQSEAKVRAYLHLAPGSTLFHRGSNRVFGFDHKVFAQQAARAGDFDRFVADQVARIDQIVPKNAGDGPFAPPVTSAESGFSLTNAGLSVLSGLGSSLRSYIGSAVISWIMSDIGLPGPIQASLQTIEAQLDAITAELQTIESTLGQVLTQLLSNLQTQLASGLAGTLNYITDTQSQMLSFSTRSDATDQNIRILAQDILIHHKTMVADIGAIQLGASGTTGLISLWVAQQAGDNGRFINTDNQQNWQNELTYYENFQLKAVNLLVEACHQANPVDLFDAERLLDQFYLSCKQQEQLLPQETSFPDGAAQAVPLETVVIDRQTHLMWSRGTLGSSTLLDIAYFMLQGDSAFGYSGWRLPTVAELQTLGITPGHLQNAAGINFDPADPWVWTIDTYDDYAGAYAVTTYQTLVNLQDGSHSGEPLKSHATYGDIPYPPASHCYLMVRGPVPQPTGLQITSTPGVGSMQFQAAQLFSDGSRESITDRAVWSVTVQGSSDPGTINSMLHISNSPDSSGLLEIRNLAPSDGFVVSATLHNLTASTTLTQIPPTDATVASILVSPVRTGLRGIDTAPFQLSASAVTQSGVSYDVTNQVRWSSSNPAALTVSAQGVATPVLPYGAQTIVTVSATYQGVTGSGKVVIP